MPYAFFKLQVGLHFAFLGFYTRTLILPTIVGVLVMAYGAFTAFVTNPSKNFCENNETTSLLICRNCRSPACPFTEVITTNDDDE